MTDAEDPRIAPLGDGALIVYLADEAMAQAFARRLRAAEFAWLEDVAPAYASVGVFFDRGVIRSADVRRMIGEELQAPMGNELIDGGPPARTHVIPCCYEMELDLKHVGECVGLTAEQVIQLHTSATYTVHAIGFCPGFPYLGYLPEKLCGVPRRDTRATRLEAGSVGLAGRQTGIYPLVRPGGWPIIGRTPLLLVDAEAGYFPIEVGDGVRFERIDAGRFAEMAGERL